jgi:hypothetical protein
VYRVRFEATWSAATHPQSFPADAHFSRLIGAAHAERLGAAIGGTVSTYHGLFQAGQLAGLGIKNMAERGDNTALRAEIQAQQPEAVFDWFESRATYVNSPGELIDTVEVNGQYPLLSAVSMIAPSPDWFVALESQNMLDAAGRWRTHVMVEARAYDAGTDSGPTFTSPDAPTRPAQPIQLITSGPLARNGSVAPLGVFHLDRIK